MIGIGIRVKSNSAVYYCLIDKENDNLNFLDVSHINVPLCLDRPESLNFVRNTLLDIMDEYNVERAVIRTAEFGGRNINKSATERFYIEGVIQESLASSNVQKFVAAQISELTRIANIPTTYFKTYASAEEEFPYCPIGKNWKKDFILEERESILACFASLKL